MYNVASDQYLGPGYYEQKGGFDKYVASTKGGAHIVQSKSCGNFLSSAPRWQDPKASKSRMHCAVPGPGSYGKAPGEEGSFNPWFKRSYNWLYAE